MCPRSIGQLVFLLVVLVWPTQAPAAPQVFVTVGPVHSLAAGVTDGISEPYLLLQGGASPHRYAMKPSQRRALEEAELVIWVGEALETFLARTMASLRPDQHVLEVLQLPGMELPPMMVAGDAYERLSPYGSDPHVWLNPHNASVIVAGIAARLTEIDPDRAEQYLANAAALRERIKALDAELNLMLEPVREQPFVVFHDAYRGLQQHYGLRQIGAITVDPSRPPGAAKIGFLRERIRKLGARCVFSEPQFAPKLVQVLTEGTEARSGVLDPLGSKHPPGQDAWFGMMRDLAVSLHDCLHG